MQRRQKMLAVVVAMATAAAVAGGALAAGASDASSARDRAMRNASQIGRNGSCPFGDVKPNDTTKIATAKLIIEYNSTDDDLGVHGAFDDHGWKTLCVSDPSGQPVLEVGPRNQLHDLTMAGIFFESREPPSSEFSFADLRAAFPEGEYTVKGQSFDGTILVGAATFTHDVPAPPTITAPEIAAEPRLAKKNPVAAEGLAIGWDPVTETVSGGPVDITGYEVIVTKDVVDDPHGFSRPTYDVHVPASVTGLSVPAEFLESNTVYELEVLALEKSGNQTISVGFFKIA